MFFLNSICEFKLYYLNSHFISSRNSGGIRGLFQSPKLIKLQVLDIEEIDINPMMWHHSALYVHYCAHVLNLILCDIAMETLNEAKLFSIPSEIF